MSIAKPIHTIPLLIWIATHICGCASSTTEHDERLEHQVPAHRPENYGDGIRQLRPRLVQLAETPSGNSTFERRRETAELIEITGWLPVLAAESPLNKGEWELVKSKSDDLLLAFNAASAKGQDVSWAETLRRAEPIIQSLESLISTAEEVPAGIDGKSPTASSSH